MDPPVPVKRSREDDDEEGKKHLKLDSGERSTAKDEASPTPAESASVEQHAQADVHKRTNIPDSNDSNNMDVDQKPATAQAHVPTSAPQVLGTTTVSQDTDTAANDNEGAAGAKTSSDHDATTQEPDKEEEPQKQEQQAEPANTAAAPADPAVAAADNPSDAEAHQALTKDDDDDEQDTPQSIAAQTSAMAGNSLPIPRLDDSPPPDSSSQDAAPQQQRPHARHRIIIEDQGHEVWPPEEIVPGRHRIVIEDTEAMDHDDWESQPERSADSPNDAQLEQEQQEPGEQTTSPSQQQTDDSKAVATSTKPNTATAQPGQSHVQRLKVEDALSYLDQVKTQFGNNPEVYTRFLDIMKDFKSQQIDTPGVIKSVSELFEGHPNLIEGFNTFLPPGYKIEVPDHDKPQQILISHPGSKARLHTTSSGSLRPVKEEPPEPSAPVVRGKSAEGGKGAAKASSNKPQRKEPQPSLEESAASGGPRKQLEFSHAIQYVNKIKTRFANRLDVYKSFLEILHTYQKQHKSINEVYAQVASLFQDHKDLLDEFSQFLPEVGPAAQAHAEKMRKQKEKKAARKPASSESAAAKRRREQLLVSDEHANALSTEELAFFEKIKSVLRPQAVYDNFLRCLNLYSHEIINRQELIQLVSNSLGRHSALFAWFKEFIGHSDAAPEAKATTEQQSHGLDLSRCKQHDQSYRALPPLYQHAKCTGRRLLNPDILKTLNDELVSFPCFSEDSSFVTSKKNINEETLFRCEDERFELDIILEANLATIRNLELALHHLNESKPYTFNVETLGGSSTVIHRKALQRLYGEHLDEVLHALKRNPRQFIPVVLKRLKQKQNEWRTAKRRWNEIWRDTLEKNYLKSLDHKHSQFKRNDPNTFKAKNIRARFKEMRDEHRKFKKLTAGTTHHRKAPPPPRIMFEYSEESVFDDIERLVQHALRRQASISAQDKKRMMNILQDFVRCQIFGIRPHTPQEESTSPTAPEEEMLSHAEQNGSATMDTRQDEEDENDYEDDKEDPVSRDANKRESNGASASAQGPTKVEAKRASRPRIQEMMTKVHYYRLDASNSHPFYTNGRWFVLFVQHQILFERIQDIKRFCSEVATAAEKTPSNHVPLAVQLALRTPTEVLPEDYFETFMSLSEQFIDQKIDLTKFEESMRELCNIHSYKALTIDKLTQAIVKQLQSLLDESCTSLMGAYLRFVQGENFDYRKHAMNMLSEEHNRIYLIEKKGPKKLSMELVDMDDDGEDEQLTATEAWMRYVESYIEFDHVNSDVLQHQSRPTFLRRSLRKAGFKGDDDAALKNAIRRNDMECLFSVNSYKMLFVAETNDVFRRLGVPKTTSEYQKRLEDKRTAKFKQFNQKWLQEFGKIDDATHCTHWLDGSDHASAIPTETAQTDQAGKAVTVYRTSAVARVASSASAQAPSESTAQAKMDTSTKEEGTRAEQSS